MTLGTLLNNKQMSRMVEVEHKPALDFESVFHFSKRGDCQLLMCFFFSGGIPYGSLWDFRCMVQWNMGCQTSIGLLSLIWLKLMKG